MAFGTCKWVGEDVADVPVVSMKFEMGWWEIWVLVSQSESLTRLLLRIWARIGTIKLINGISVFSSCTYT